MTETKSPLRTTTTNNGNRRSEDLRTVVAVFLRGTDLSFRIGEGGVNALQYANVEGDPQMIALRVGSEDGQDRFFILPRASLVIEYVVEAVAD